MFGIAFLIVLAFAGLAVLLGTLALVMGLFKLVLRVVFLPVVLALGLIKLLAVGLLGLLAIVAVVAVAPLVLGVLAVLAVPALLLGLFALAWGGLRMAAAV